VSTKETIKLCDMAQKIYNTVNGGLENKSLEEQVYLWFWMNEQCRHVEDVDIMTSDLNKLDKIINDPGRRVIDVETAKAMRQFLSEELKRHKDELENISRRMLNFNLVSSIPAIRVEVE